MDLHTLPAIRGTYTPLKPLAPLTTMKVGGPAEVWADFADMADLQDFLRHKPAHVPFTIVGEGSNLVIREGGIAGVVTTLGKLLNDVSISGNVMHAQAGATCGKAARAAREAGLAGLAFYAGIPGSIGGALRMNAGCYGHETADFVTAIEVLTDKGEAKTLNPAELHYSYRHSQLPANWLFTAATFALKAGDKEEIRAEMSRINTERRNSQPLDKPSSGSWFKNPVHNGVKLSAWKVVDAAGCRGLAHGGAQVSEKHSNFFINTGGATATDLDELSNMVEAKVLETQGIMLEREVKFTGITK
ncbi:MAG: UDP-N-acetylmuramate dehydrogenase [Alphaproteobacteria bacterium]